MYIIWTFPDVPSWNTMFMLEAMTFKVAVSVEKTVDPSDIVVDAWTNIYHKDNPEGEWHAIPLSLITSKTSDDDEPTILTFGNAVMLTSDGTYAFTFRVKVKSSADWLWKGDFEENGIITVHPPTDDRWTKGPSYTEILGPVYLGNFMAASVADELGFDAVLNVADSLDLITSKFSKAVDYKKIPMRDGAVNPIPPEMIQEAVEWLKERSKTCSKILVNCRAGIGRAGSVAVAYVYAEDTSFSYEDAYNFVFKKRFVYPHKGLRDTLNNLYPRKE
ncbi:dual specificity protein phosphatase 4-like [Babylonia areolata]|uniref:dual specificity protein phosphatase 4-like n=1 Tax=Babylonia areolata TaxID=304850 RepID=UPI003FD02BD4